MKTEALRRIFGRSLRSKRQGKAITQERLAELTSLTRTSITNIERGHQLVSITALYELADALDVEIDELLPSREEVQRQLEAMSKLPPTAEDKADIADWINSVTADPN